MLNGKTALITGSNKGMGYQIALALARRNCRVIMADKDCQIESRNKIVAETCNENISIKSLDLSSLKSVRSFAEDLIQHEKQLHILVNNAGVFRMDNKKTCDGLDAVIQINHLGPFLLTNLLTDILKQSGEGRIIFVTSVGAFLNTLSPNNLVEPQKFGPDIFSSVLHYYNSKLCNMIVSKIFAERLKYSNVTSNCLHPGMTGTDFLIQGFYEDGYIAKSFKSLMKSVIKIGTRDSENAAGLAVFLATSDSVKSVTGKYFVNYQEHVYPKILENEKFCRSIWEESERLVGISNKCGNNN